MQQVTLQVPDSLDMSAFDISMWVASRLYAEGKLSSGQAAEMVGISKRAFIELMGKYKVSAFGYDMEDLEEDLGHEESP